MEVERHDPLGAGVLDHVGDQLGRDRLAAFRFLVLLGVTVVGDHRRDAVRRRAAQRVDDQQKFHDRVVDRRVLRRAAQGLHDEDFGAAHVLADLDPALVVLEPVDQRVADARLHLLGDLVRQQTVRGAAEQQGRLDHEGWTPSASGRRLSTKGKRGYLRADGSRTFTHDAGRPRGTGRRRHNRAVRRWVGGRVSCPSSSSFRPIRWPAISRAPPRRWPTACSAATARRRCWASPARARRWRWRGSSSWCRSRRWCCRTTRRWRPSCAPSSASSFRRTRSSTSSRTSTTTSPRRTSRTPTPTSPRIARSTTRSSGCGTRRPSRC